MLEVECGDHQDYKFPVDAEYIGDISIFDLPDDDGGTVKCSPTSLYMQTHEVHALIYTDGCIAVTLYENCYNMWHIPSGTKAGDKNWKLTDVSVQQIRQFAEKRNSELKNVI
jgi:hypothetical protein